MSEDVVRFGDGLELDRAAYELRRSGRPLRLERIPMETLLLLIECRGQLVSREEIIARVWGKDVFLDTDTSINSAIRKIRQVLKDDPENPAFIQTVTGKGYRFIAPVTLPGDPSSASVPAPALPPAPLRSPLDYPPVAPIAVPAAAIPVDRSAMPALGGGPPAKARSSRRSWLFWAPIGGAVLVVAGVAAWFLRPKPAEPPMSAPIPLTTYRGNQEEQSFAPDGTQVAFAWDGEKKDNFDIYVKPLGPDAAPLRLTGDPAPDRYPAWSPDGGTIAFEREIAPGKIDVMLIPALGGPERKLAEFSERIDILGLRISWTLDGKSLIVPAESGGDTALFLVSVETGKAIQISNPTAGFEDLNPSVSPDGRDLLFTRNHKVFYFGDVYVVRLDANGKPIEAPRRIFEGGAIEGVGSLVWTADGKDILARTATAVVRMPADGSAPPTQVAWSGALPNVLEVSRQNNRLAFSVFHGDSNIYRIDLTAKVAKPEPLIASISRDVFPQYSPDGGRLAFYTYRTGRGQVWVGDSEGKQLRQLTFVRQGQAATPHWSPDGKTLALDSNNTGPSEIYTINPDGGELKQLTHGPYANFSATWSRDGKSMYFTSKQAGDDEIWKMPNGGGPSVQVTHNGGIGAIESFDGKTLYFGKDTGAGSIWKMPVGGGPEEEIADSLYRTNFAVAKRGIYYMTGPGNSGASTLKFYNFATKATETILQMGWPEYGLDVCPDGRYLVYAQLDDPASNLMLLENFH